MNICIFPGTFNPIHIAHINMANYALSKYNFDKIIFIPSYIPPHKILDKNLAKHRLNMVKLAVKNNSKFEVSDIEYKTEAKSYTLNTVIQIIKDYKINGKLNMIIGTDAFKDIKSWYKTQELSKLVHFLVFPRNNDTIDSDEYSDYSFEIANFEKIDISSTDLRKNKENNELQNVKEYIKQNELYS